MMKMTFFKTCVFLGCMISMLEFSVGDKVTSNINEPGHSEIPDSGELRRGEVAKALQKGEISIVKRLIKEGVLEEYYHGIYDQKESTTLKKIKDKIDVLFSLLQLKLVSIPTKSFVSRQPSNKRLFNVTLIPGTDLSVKLLINLTAVKDESLAKEGNAPLYYICSLPDVEPEVVKMFLDFGTIEIDTWDDSNHLTALIIAAARGNLELVKFLVDNGADINNSVPTALDPIGRLDRLYDYIKIFTRKQVVVHGINVPISAVVAAAYENHPEVLGYLLENGGDVNNKGHAWCVLFSPAFKGYAEVIEILLKNGIDVNSKGPFGSTALHRVAETGNTEMAKLLLMYGADSNLTNNFGWTPLHVATLFGVNNSRKIVELLLDSGCDANTPTDGGFTPLNLAEAATNIRFLEYLVNNSDSIKFDKHKKLAESEHNLEHIETLELLINRGAELDHQDDILGWTALHWAAANGDLVGAKFLVEKHGAAMNLKSKMGMTPFRTAKHFGREALSEYLNTGRNLVE